jgi:glycine dehydrogenase subunit 1
MTALSRKNMVAGDVPFFLGCGAYKHHIPASVDHIIQRGEFLTSYTPYQPEIAQGTLQMMFEFQTQVARPLRLRHRQCVDVRRLDRLLGSDRDGRTRHPPEEGDPLVRASPALRQRLQHYGEVHRRHAGDEAFRRCQPRRTSSRLSLRSTTRPARSSSNIPTFSAGSPTSRRSRRRPTRRARSLIAVVTEPVALGLIKSPGEMGADIVVGEGQSIGVGLQFGGPYVGTVRLREKHVRQMPGRLAGETVDAEGKRGFVLTLSTREQHIRREKATSNICTSSVLVRWHSQHTDLAR